MKPMQLLVAGVLYVYLLPAEDSRATPLLESK